MNKLGNLIREKRRSSGKSIRELCKEVEISKPYLMDIETGRVKKVSFKILENLSNSLNLDKKDLFPIDKEFSLTLPIDSTIKNDLARVLLKKWNTIDQEKALKIIKVLK